MKKRLPYIIIFILLIAVEVVIAKTQHGNWLRNSGGDVIVVWVVYCFVQSIICLREKPFHVHIGVMLFAFLVEALQAVHIVDLIGLGDIRFFRILIGTTFVPGDLLCYAGGTAVGCLGSWIFRCARNRG